MKRITYFANRFCDGKGVYGTVINFPNASYMVEENKIEYEVYDTADETIKITAICHKIKKETIATFEEVE